MKYTLWFAYSFSCLYSEHQKKKPMSLLIFFPVNEKLAEQKLC